MDAGVIGGSACFSYSFAVAYAPSSNKTSCVSRSRETIMDELPVKKVKSNMAKKQVKNVFIAC